MRIALFDFTCLSRIFNHHICEALSRAGNDVIMYGRPYRPKERLKSANYSYRDLMFPLSEKLFTTKGTRRIRQFLKGLEYFPNILTLIKDLKRFKPDVINFLWVLVPLFDIWLIKRLKETYGLVLTVQDTRLRFGPDAPPVMSWRRLRAFALFDHIIVQTNSGKDTLVSYGLPAGNIGVVPHGILKPLETEESGPWGEDSSDEFKKRSEKVILFFGSIEQIKGIDLLIEAFAKLDVSLRRITELWIAGVPNTPMGQFRRLAKKLGVDSRINWILRLIYDFEIPLLYEAADVSVFPYNYFDVSKALLTAFPFGKPLVATNAGIFSEYLKDGVHGRLFPNRDSDALAGALESVLTDDEAARRMGEAVKALSGSVPSWEEVAKKTLRAYEAALAKTV